MTRGKKIILTEKQIEDICSLYLSGLSTRDISKVYLISYQKVSSILKSKGILLDGATRISSKAKGRVSPNKGKARSEESKLKQSNATKGRPGKKGYIFTEEQRLKMSISRKEFILRTPNWNIKQIKASKENARDTEETLLINKQRSTYKRLITRLLKLTYTKKNSKTEQYLGYSKQEFIDHIESKFKEGMSWLDRSSFHIDHIIPVSVLLKYNVVDPKIVNSLDNLQPLPPLENISKSNKISKKEVESFLFKYGVSI